ncbi:hypothetical protein PybrP1_001658 [[Pythium] brassicae (nom. inval.)]|nr:hypothetical protein PybrP1_001658 [[Pythium] brassicae (nom. inval.)]
MARAQSMCFIRLPDLFTMDLKREGPTKSSIVGVIMDRRKSNQFGRVDYGGCVRHTDVQACPVGALALHTFWYFHVR